MLAGQVPIGGGKVNADHSRIKRICNGSNVQPSMLLQKKPAQNCFFAIIKMLTFLQELSQMPDSGIVNDDDLLA